MSKPAKVAVSAYMYVILEEGKISTLGKRELFWAEHYLSQVKYVLAVGYVNAIVQILASV